MLRTETISFFEKFAVPQSRTTLQHVERFHGGQDDISPLGGGSYSHLPLLWKKHAPNMWFVTVNRAADTKLGSAASSPPQPQAQRCVKWLTSGLYGGGALLVKTYLSF